MDSARRPGAGAFSPMPSTPTTPIAPYPQHHQRSPSTESDSSADTHVTAMSSNRRPTYPQRPTLVTTSSSANSSTTSLHNFSRPSIAQVVSDVPSRKNSPLNPTNNDPRSHKRNNSQGFFEPSLPTASQIDQSSMMSGLSASQIAAQAAMQQQNSQHARKRSQTVPSPQDVGTPQGRQKPPPLPIPHSNNGSRRPSGAAVMPPPQFPQSRTNSPTLAAASAASTAYPGQPQLSPGFTSFNDLSMGERDGKQKSDRKLNKLFSSRPKHIGIPSYKGESGGRPIPSPGKPPTQPNIMSAKMNASTTTLDSLSTAGGSIYGMQNSSTSTLVPSDRQKAEDREKAHRHHFLSRQKHKLKDKMDDHSTLNLSSAASNSQPVNPNAPASLYNFAPASPGLSQGAFSKSTTGLDLRHGGRALREKKREEKAAAFNPDSKLPDPGWPFAPTSSSNPSVLGGVSGADYMTANLQGFGLTNMTADEAWDFLKAKLLIIFEGEEMRMTVEDLNKLVTIHIQRCVQKRLPAVLLEDLEDLLQTGFLSLDQTLRGIPEEKLVPYLVEMWLFVFGTVLPYIQAVFLPLDLEFKGNGSIMSASQAKDFWGPEANTNDDPNAQLDVRRYVLLTYRDTVILPRHDTLKAIFSRLSLESINVVADSPLPLPSPRGELAQINNRPGTAGSGSLDPNMSSFNSQGSTLLGDINSRSRATSNTSAPELPPFSPSGRGTQLMVDSSKVTEMVGRMLQCMSVLSSLDSEDVEQEKMEGLTKALKLNWLGRGRTGRNRKGFVGARVVRRVGVGA